MIYSANIPDAYGKMIMINELSWFNGEDAGIDLEIEVNTGKLFGYSMNLFSYKNNWDYQFINYFLIGV